LPKNGEASPVGKKRLKKRFLPKKAYIETMRGGLAALLAGKMSEKRQPKGEICTKCAKIAVLMSKNAIETLGALHRVVDAAEMVGNKKTAPEQ
jgi:hypothetical protein